jgi:hypothetical protein
MGTGDMDGLLKLMAEGYGRMMLQSRDSSSCSEEDIDAWLRALLEMVQCGGSDTVVALHTVLQQRHKWLRLADVFEGLLCLRERYGSRN